MGQRWENEGHRFKGPAHTHAIGNKIINTAGRHDNPPGGVVKMTFTPHFKLMKNKIFVIINS